MATAFPNPAPEHLKPATPRNSSGSNTSSSRRRTLKQAEWSYIHLSLQTSTAVASTASPLEPSSPLDLLTAKQYLTAALSQFLGLTGAGIAVDILKLENRDLWIRVMRADERAVLAALGGWVGRGDSDGGMAGLEQVSWVVRGRSDWVGALRGGSSSSLWR